MMIAFGGGIWIGYKLNDLVAWVKVKFNKKEKV
jgi:hypothetical protein